MFFVSLLKAIFERRKITTNFFVCAHGWRYGWVQQFYLSWSFMLQATPLEVHVMKYDLSFLNII